MRCAPCFALPLVLVVGLGPGVSVASAQTMFIDTNGDGRHDAGDVINPAGTTLLEFWVWTDTNADGSEATCPEAGTPLDMFSWEIVLDVGGGMVSWARFTSLLAGWTGGFAALRPDSLHLFRYAPPGERLPPGRYKVATIEVTVTAGTPAIAWSAYDDDPAGASSFGGACPGALFTNTMALGADWFEGGGVMTAGSIDDDPPAPIVPLDPADGAAGVLWYTALTALPASDVHGPVQYQFEVFATNDCTLAPLATGAWQRESAWTWDRTYRESTTFSWRFRARDAAAPGPNVSDWSACSLFTTAVDLEPPVGVGNVSPTEWALDVPTHPTLVARAAMDPTTPIVYQFELYTEDGAAGPCGGPVVETSPFEASTSWTPWTPLALGTRYYWRNRAADDASTPNVSRWSDCWVFTTTSTVEPDAGPTEVDAGPPEVDAGPPEVDAGPMDLDAGVPDVDAGPSDVDGGAAGTDAGVESDAGGVVVSDGGVVDAGAPEADAGEAAPDAAMDVDAEPAGRDAGRGPHDPGPGSGCDCHAAAGGGRPSLWALVPVLAMVTFATRRRRR